MDAYFEEEETTTAYYTGAIKYWLESHFGIGRDRYETRALKEHIDNLIIKEMRALRRK